ncbi:AKAP7 2'5' RNA ligase-like domain-containing protein [Blastocladiella britannica]|nr:AKAP7 2'5' RNA ligase-like domain-containing protein [Blastocladiella britannica]
MDRPEPMDVDVVRYDDDEEADHENGNTHKGNASRKSAMATHLTFRSVRAAGQTFRVCAASIRGPIADDQQPTLARAPVARVPAQARAHAPAPAPISAPATAPVPVHERSAARAPATAPAPAPAPATRPAVSATREPYAPPQRLQKQQQQQQQPRTIVSAPYAVAAGNRAQIPCDPKLFRNIIGPGGRTVQDLRRESGADVHVPSQTSTDRAITVRGTPDQIAKATALIEAIIAGASRRNEPYTHFLGLPVPLPSVNPELHAAIRDFQTRLIAAAPPVGQPLLRAIPTTEVHLTLGMLRLPTPDHLARAVDALTRATAAIHEAVDSRSVRVGLAGAHSFKAADRTNLVWAGVIDIDQQVAKLARLLLDEFVAAGLLLPEEATRLPNLHATMLRYEPSRGGDHSRAPPSFDATALLAIKDVVVDDLRFPSVQLLKREPGPGPEGTAYFTEAEVALP